jgi:transglutaminase-like putative cysteine protease
MRIRISHETRYHYDAPINGVIQTLRLTPRNHEGQYVVHWRIDVSEDCRLDVHEDAFGNITHTFTAEGPFAALGVQVEGEIDVENTAGIVHATLARLHDEITFDTDPTHSATTAAEAFALKRGVCQDLTHIFIATARQLGIPARYVGGYFHRADGVTHQDAGHAWAEAHVPAVGWIAFDPANGICATDSHVRVAVGLDYLGAAPVRGARRGGGAETMAVKVRVDQAARQVQS